MNIYDFVDSDITNQSYTTAWKEEFKDKIPEKFEGWIGVDAYFEKPKQVGYEPEVFDMAVTHPNHLVVNITGTNFLLEPHQLEAALLNPFLPEWNLSQIINAQNENSVETTQDIVSSYESVVQIRESINFLVRLLFSTFSDREVDCLLKDKKESSPRRIKNDDYK